jgi:hypothetical protein
MPEGPEVYALSIALNLLGYNTFSHGKHLYFRNTNEDWFFGLAGKVMLKKGILRKSSHKFFDGYITEYDNLMDFLRNKRIGIDWLNCNDDELKAKIASLLTNQSYIAGIGVSWCSEILYYAGISPDDKANECSKEALFNSMIFVKNNIKKFYENIVIKSDNLELFVNKWFKNLYAIRKLDSITNKRQEIKINGRMFWK